MPWKQIGKSLTLFAIGGTLYYFIEVAWRFFAGTPPTHWSMAFLGGIVFVLIGAINELLPWEMPLPLQCLIGGAMATIAEFLAGLILNVWLGLDIWDYANLPLNFMGQITLFFSLAWIGLSLVAIFLDDWFRHWLFGEEHPHYRLW